MVVFFFLLVSKYEIIFSNKLFHVTYASSGDSDTCPTLILQTIDRNKIQRIVGVPKVEVARRILLRGEGKARDEPLPGQTD